jgi:hypothetical protein
MSPDQRESLISSICYALRFKCLGLKWKRDSEPDTRIAAAAILDHLLLCRVNIEPHEDEFYRSLRASQKNS